MLLNATLEAILHLCSVLVNFVLINEPISPNVESGGEKRRVTKSLKGHEAQDPVVSNFNFKLNGSLFKIKYPSIKSGCTKLLMTNVRH